MCTKLATLLNAGVVLFLITTSTAEEGLKGDDYTDWGAWSGWKDQGSCGESDVTGYTQTRTRTRVCEIPDCAAQQLETRFLEVCANVTAVYINLPDTYHAGTTADLWMGIRQGDIYCSTSRPTWDAPDSGPGTYWRGGRRGCTKTFDYTKKVEIYLFSDSDNDVYIRYMGAQIGMVDHTWTTRNKGDGYTAIDSDENNGWYTTD